MQTYILQENVLTDNLLLLPDEGKAFKGGFIARIIEYVYNTAWTDRELVKDFRSQSALDKYLTKVYPEFQY